MYCIPDRRLPVERSLHHCCCYCIQAGAAVEAAEAVEADAAVRLVRIEVSILENVDDDAGGYRTLSHIRTRV